MKILLLGANGQLGRSFMEDGGLAARGPLVAASRDGTLWNGARGEVADLAQPGLRALLDRVQPELIVNAAAYTAVDRAEQEQALATRINGEAVGELGAWAAAHGARVLHYSTDYVFDGAATAPYAVDAPTAPLGAYGRSKLAGEQEQALATRINGKAVGELGAWAATHGARVLHYSTDYVFDGAATAPYAVDAPTAPLGAYGRSKLAGEQALRASGADHLILRTAWVYAPHGHNFLRTMLRLGAEREELRVVADQIGAPTSTALIVRASLAALDQWLGADDAQRASLRGTHHLVASGHTSWHGFACAIFDEARARGLIPRAPRVLPIATAEYPTPARRPTWSVLDNRGFQQQVGYPLPDWRDGLREVMDRLAG